MVTDSAASAPEGNQVPPRLIPADSVPELQKIFSGMLEPVELLAFTAPGTNTPYNDFLTRLCNELAEIAPKLTITAYPVDSEQARARGVDFSPTLLIAPDRYNIRYVGAPVGEESRTLVEIILRASSGQSGLTEASRTALAGLEEARDIKIFVSPTCPYCPGQALNAFRCAIERPDRISAACVDSSQHRELAEHFHVGSVPHTVINETFNDVGLMEEGHFISELLGLEKVETPQPVNAPDDGLALRHVDLVVAGAGPAGLTAAIYAARSGLSAVILEKNAIGGQVALTPVVENYPGFANIPGKRLMEIIADQARHYADIHEGEGIEEVKVGRNVEVYTNKAIYVAKALILTTGATWKKLGAPGEDRYFGFGVSYCSTCDGYLYRGKKAVVVGGGNTALTDALHLKNLGVDVTLIHRRDDFRAEKYLQDALAKENIPVIKPAEVLEISGDENKVTRVRIRSATDGTEQELATDAVFVAIGLRPNTEIAMQLGLALDSRGFIEVDRANRTSIPRIYAAGDVTGGSQQIVSAVGEGSTAALAAFEDLAHPYWKKESQRRD